MDRTERFYRIELLIRNRGGVSFRTLLGELEVSPATLKRDLRYPRERMDGPIVYDRGDDAYRFAPAAAVRPTSHELPGVWFSEHEIHALLKMHQLIAGLRYAGQVEVVGDGPLRDAVGARLVRALQRAT
jgi:predicted DNA-binding transcriptional regulator YafY